MRKSVYILMHNRLNNDQKYPRNFVSPTNLATFPRRISPKSWKGVSELRRGDHVQFYVNQVCCGSVNLTSGIARQLSVKTSNSELLKNSYHLFRFWYQGTERWTDKTTGRITRFPYEEFYFTLSRMVKTALVKPSMLCLDNLFLKIILN